MTRILLVGFMAAGKTTLGKALARDLGLQFVDLDHYIENRYHCTVAQLFAERGEEAFRQIERNMLHEVAEFEDVVISTGGGTPCFFDNMDYMNEVGTTVYMQATADVILEHFKLSKSERPLLKGKSADELREFVETQLEARAPFYEKAQHRVQVNVLHDAKLVNDLALQIIEQLQREPAAQQ